MIEAIDRWISRLIRAGRAAISDLPDPQCALTQAERERVVAEFSDEMGVCRPVDRMIAARVYGAVLGPGSADESEDLAWWRFLINGGKMPAFETHGPMTPRRDDLAIEIRTETELAVLHAAWSVAIERRDERLIERCLEACVWHVAELEPDNGTGHAWALHGFVLCAQERGMVEAEMHAQSLLHRCMMGTGAADRVSAMLVLDAARSLVLWTPEH